MATLESVNELLEQAAATLTSAMKALAADRSPSVQSKLARIGAAQVEIFEAQYQIWALKPDLLPQVLRAPAGDPQVAFDLALRRVKEYVSVGAVDAAVGVLDIFILYQTSARQLQLAKMERMRLANG
jgi:hypothetical protein